MYNKIKNCLKAAGFVITEYDKLEREGEVKLDAGIGITVSNTEIYITYVFEYDEIWIYDMDTNEIRFIITNNGADYIMLFNLGAAIENIACH